MRRRAESLLCGSGIQAMYIRSVISFFGAWDTIRNEYSVILNYHEEILQSINPDSLHKEDQQIVAKTSLRSLDENFEELFSMSGWITHVHLPFGKESMKSLTSISPVRGLESKCA